MAINELKEQNKPIDLAAPQQRTLWQDAWRRLIRSNTARLGMVIIAVFILSAIYARLFWKYDPLVDLDYTLKLKAPNLVVTEEIPSIHIFGTDKLGRDIFRRVVHGGWNSLLVGIVAVGISLVIGGLLGLFSGFYEGTTITPLERIFFMGAVGLALGALPAWIARQSLHIFLFGALGVVSAFYSNFFAGKKARNLIFAVVGLLIGALLSLFTAPLVAIVCGIIGMAIGWLLGSQLEGQLFSNIVMRFMDIILSFPGYLLAIAIVAFLGPGLAKGMIAIGIVGIPVYARLVRSAVLSVSSKEYNVAAQALGASHPRIIFRHIFPNILSPIIVQTTMGLASAILSAAALGFLGLGAIPPEPEWGAMLGDSYRYLTSGAWWAVLFPGLAIMLSVLGFNLLGDGLRDALDPKLRT
jgi:ABC-type dipeptide/oligopeptide/nickel transport system permease subunit